MTADSTPFVKASADGESHASAGALYVTFGLLMLLLAATVTADQFLKGTAGTAAGLSISVLKTALIVAVFMNLRGSTALIRLASVAAVLWLSFALMFVMGDYITRGWNESEDHLLRHAADVSSFQEMRQSPEPADAVVR
jgi:caa(3)-type oxidase subunit IV